MKTIALTQGKVALVDNADYAELSKHKWYAPQGYAMRSVNHRSIFMHRVIMNTPAGMETDHINGNRLDNRRTNLRVCTRAENARNRAACQATSSKFRGVAYHSDGKKWQAHIRIDGRLRYIGLFANEDDAARAYDARALQAWGEYARLNFPAAHAVGVSA